MFEVIFTIFGFLLFAAGVFFYAHSRSEKKLFEARERDTNERMYELAILKEIGDRIGYSLNVQNIADVIVGSLHQFIEYSAVSYMLLEGDKVVFKINLANPVSRGFIDDIRNRMLSSLEALLNKDVSHLRIEELITGTFQSKESTEPVRSFFNIPLVIGENARGILTVAHTRPGLYKESEMTLLYKIIGQASNAVSRLEEVIQTEQEKTNAMIESMAEGVIMFDREFRIIAINPAAKRALGLTPETLPTVLDIVGKLGTAINIKEKIEESLTSRQMIISRDVFIGNQAFEIYVSPVESNRKARAGEVLGSVVIFHDVTHDKEVEQMREDFTSMMVHELRSPLDNIKKMSALMLDSKEKPISEFKEYINLAHQNSSEMLELVNDLLDVAKLESGKFEITKRAINVRELVRERIGFFEIAARHSQISLESHLCEGVPEEIQADPLRLSEVLNNLLSNALKFTGNGGRVTMSVFFHVLSQDILKEAEQCKVRWFMENEESRTISKFSNAVVFAVTDTGPGIFPEEKGLLFSKFKQLKKTVKGGDKKGTGLGLTIAKGIVEAHGGTIGVASIPGQGSTFYFLIPPI